MIVTKSRNPDSYVLDSAKIEITHGQPVISADGKSWSLAELQDLGLARGVKVGFASSKIDIKADNGIVDLKGTTNESASIEFSLLERHLPLLAQVMKGIVYFEVIPKEEQTFTEEKEENTLVKGGVYEFKEVNFDGSKPKNIIIKQEAKTLSDGNDYKIVRTSVGDWGFELLSAGTFEAGKKTEISYKVKGIKSWKMGHGSGGAAVPLGVKLTNMRKSADGRTITRSFEFPYAHYEADDSIAFKSMNDSDNIAEVPVKFTCSPHPDLSLNPNFAGTALSQEVQEK